MSVSIEITATGNAVAALAAAAAKLSDLTPLMDEIGRELVTSTRQRFEQEEGPDGSPWPKSARALVQGGQTLRDTGMLYRSITHRAEPQTVRVGTNLIYAAIHQFGGTIRAKTAKGLRFRPAGGNGFVSVKSVRIPARPYLGLSAADGREVEAIAGDFMGGALGGPDAG